MDVSTLPSDNVQIFALIYVIETSMRELIIETLTALDGPRWYKHHLPEDVLEKYRSGRESERRTPWTRCVPHHPIYYVDFPDLRRIIERGDNWRQAFHPIFRRKELLSATLADIEPIRNKIAHNRRATRGDLEVVQGAYRKICTAVGDDRLSNLSTRCTIAEDIYEQFTGLEQEACRAFDTIMGLGSLKILTRWEAVRREWWFDESYMGINLDAIQHFFDLAHEYCALPRTRGTGHLIEAWIREHDMPTQFALAQSQFRAILAIESEKE